MRSIKDIMLDLGFNKDAPIETQKAFIRHLIATANVQESVAKFEKHVEKRLGQSTEPVIAAAQAREITDKHKNKVGEQMTFDLGESQRVS